MSIAREQQMKVVERVILPHEIPLASEVFLAGTAAEVTPVRQIAEHQFTPGPITETLMRGYEAMVRMAPEQAFKLAS
jgi:branched-chain amino acid aminotransferase